MAPEDIKKVFKTNLKRERIERGWSVNDLATKTGMYRQTLEKCESHGTFSAKSIAAICEAMDIDPWVLFIEEA